MRTLLLCVLALAVTSGHKTRRLLECDVHFYTDCLLGWRKDSSGVCHCVEDLNLFPSAEVKAKRILDCPVQFYHICPLGWRKDADGKCYCVDNLVSI